MVAVRLNKIDENSIHQRIKEVVDEYKKSCGAVKIIFEDVNEDTIKKVGILLQNDGLYVDEDNFVIIWDKFILKQYTEQLNSVCSRRCNKKEKAKCTGCIEYKASTPLHLIKEKVKVVA